jgi:hypothetical protein
MPVSLGETDGRAASSILRDKVIADRSLGTVLCPNAGESHTVQELRSGAKHFWNTVVRICGRFRARPLRLSRASY